MARLPPWPLLALLLTGCGGKTQRTSDPPAPSPDPPGSLSGGDRITVRAWASGDEILGPKLLWDRGRDMRCNIGLAEDGTTRCLPEITGFIRFLDAACTEPVVVERAIDRCRPPPAYLAYRAPAECPPPVTLVVQKGAARVAPPVSYAWVGSLCFPESVDPESEWFDAERSSPEDWVAFDRETSAATDRLEVESWRGVDGSWVPGGLVLRDGGDPCDPEGTSDVRCVPSRRAVPGAVTYFADSACTVGVFTAPECDRAAIGMSATSPSGCRVGDADYYELEEVDPADLHTGDPTCAAAPLGPGSGQRYYARGAPIDPARYPPLELLAVGEGELLAEFWFADGKPILPASELHGAPIVRDNDAGTTCEVIEFEDGTSLCIGGAVKNRQTFADSACTLPVGVRSSGICAPAVADPKWIVVSVLDECGHDTASAVWTVGGRHDGALYVDNGAGRCDPVTPGAALGDVHYYAPGEPVAPAELFRGVAEIDLEAGEP